MKPMHQTYKNTYTIKTIAVNLNKTITVVVTLIFKIKKKNCKNDMNQTNLIGKSPTILNLTTVEMQRKFMFQTNRRLKNIDK